MNAIEPLEIIGLRLAVNWSHKLLPTGEYPKTVDELLSAFPELANEKFEVCERISQYTNEPAVMVRARVDKALRQKVNSIWDKM